MRSAKGVGGLYTISRARSVLDMRSLTRFHGKGRLHHNNISVSLYLGCVRT